MVRRRLPSARAVELTMDVARELARDARDRLELLATGPRDAIGRAEVLEQRALSCRPDTGKLVEQRTRERPRSPLAVKVEREAVGLVADPLQEPRGLGVRADRQRIRAARDEHLLESLGQAD